MKKIIIALIVIVVVVSVFTIMRNNENEEELIITMSILEVSTDNKDIILNAPMFALAEGNSEEEKRIQSILNDIVEEREELIITLNELYKSANIDCTYEVSDNKTIFTYKGNAIDKEDKEVSFEKQYSYNFDIEQYLDK